MNEDVFNTSLRGFLKKVGITSQREIEKAVRDAVAAGRLKGNEKLPAKMVLTIGGVELPRERSAKRSSWDRKGRRLSSPLPFWGRGSGNMRRRQGGGIGRPGALLVGYPHPALSHKGKEEDGAHFLQARRKNTMDIKVRDPTAPRSPEGDSVTLTKDLKLKGCVHWCSRHFHDPRHSSHRQCRRDRRPHRQGQGPGAAHGVLEGVKGPEAIGVALRPDRHVVANSNAAGCAPAFRGPSAFARPPYSLVRASCRRSSSAWRTPHRH